MFSTRQEGRTAGNVELGLARLLGRTVRPRRGYRSVALLADASVQRTIARFGYCVTDHRVPAESVARLTQIAADLGGGNAEAEQTYALGWGQSPTLPSYAFEEVRRLAAADVEPLLNLATARTTFTAFQVKPATTSSALGAHQDSFMVDERSSYGLFAWIPLGESSIENGALFVLPGSHIYGNWRRISSAEDEFADLHQVIERYARVITAETGQIVLFDNALIHGSLANASGQPRIAASCAILPRATDPLRATVSPTSGPDQLDLFRVDGIALDAAKSPESITEHYLATVPRDRLAVGPQAFDLVCRLNRTLRGGAPGLPLTAARPGSPA